MICLRCGARWGEKTNCTVSGFDRLLQKEVLCGLKRAHAVVCDSQATHDDLLRLAGQEIAQRPEVIPRAIENSDDPMRVERMILGYKDVYRRV